LFALFAGMSVAALGYRYEARLMPLVVGVPSLLASAVLALRRSARDGPGTSPDAESDAALLRRGAAALGWLAVFASLVAIGGVVLGGAAAVLCTQRLWLRERWRTAVFSSVGSAALLTWVFERQLGIGLFRGLLQEWLR
jgi:ABC-type sugar transport system permease subunit